MSAGQTANSLRTLVEDSRIMIVYGDGGRSTGMLICSCIKLVRTIAMTRLFIFPVALRRKILYNIERNCSGR